MKSIVVILSGLLLITPLAACVPVNDAGRQLPPQVQTLMEENQGAYVVLTLSEALNSELEQRLDEAGIVLFDPLGEYRYQAYVPQTAVSTLATLQDNNLILEVAAIDPASKIKGEFANSQETYNVIVHFYAPPTTNETAVLTDHMIINRTAEGAMNFVEGQATDAQIKQMAELPFVKLIEQAVVYDSGNES